MPKTKEEISEILQEWFSGLNCSMCEDKDNPLECRTCQGFTGFTLSQGTADLITTKIIS